MSVGVCRMSFGCLLGVFRVYVECPWDLCSVPVECLWGVSRMPMGCPLIVCRVPFDCLSGICWINVACDASVFWVFAEHLSGVLWVYDVLVSVWCLSHLSPLVRMRSCVLVYEIYVANFVLSLLSAAYLQTTDWCFDLFDNPCRRRQLLSQYTCSFMSESGLSWMNLKLEKQILSISLSLIEKEFYSHHYI